MGQRLQQGVNHTLFRGKVAADIEDDDSLLISELHDEQNEQRRRRNAGKPAWLRQRDADELRPRAHHHGERRTPLK